MSVRVNQPPVILVLGPTAGGKTRLAIQLASRLPGGGECISADSMQVYRGMDIGTAKPAQREREDAPHHLLDLIEPDDEGFSVDTWLGLAEQTIAEIRSRGRWPIVVGGTNLYVQALLHGLFEGPQPDESLRQRLRSLPSDQLRAHLEQIDPASAQRIHPNDRKRTIRAIEVFEQTGQRISDLQTQWQAPPARNDATIIGLDFSAAVINGRINARVKKMIDDGLVEEVRRLYEAGRLGSQAREALGYKQIIDALENRCTLAEAIEQIKIQTRRYAKQQRTWLRRFRATGHAIWLPAEDMDADELVNRALAFILAGQNMWCSPLRGDGGCGAGTEPGQVDSRDRHG